jgi:hypothetical protein
MKRIRISFVVADRLVFPLAAAGARNAASAGQTARKPVRYRHRRRASDLTYAMNEIAANFEGDGFAVRLTIARPEIFILEIENGAPFDVFPRT